MQELGHYLVAPVCVYMCQRQKVKEAVVSMAQTKTEHLGAQVSLERQDWKLRAGNCLLLLLLYQEKQDSVYILCK